MPVRVSVILNIDEIIELLDEQDYYVSAKKLRAIKQYIIEIVSENDNAQRALNKG